MLINSLLRWTLIYLAATWSVSAAELSPIEAEIEAIYAQYANSEDNAELEPIKALKTRALDGSVRDQRAFWYALCVMHSARQEKAEAQEALTAMLALQQQHHDPSLAADTRVCEAQVAEANNRVHDAFRLFESAFELSQQPVDAFAMYRVGVSYAGAASRRGEYEKALKALQTAYRGADLLGDVKRQLTIHASMAWAQFELNQPETALATYAAAKKLALQHKLERIHMWLINNEAVVMTTLNRLDEAQQLYEQVLEQSQRYASEEGVLTAYINLSDIQLRKKNYAEAERLALIGLQQAPENRLEEA
jgi:tetratricopeptide (TPR) repeat protein